MIQLLYSVSYVAFSDNSLTTNPIVGRTDSIASHGTTHLYPDLTSPDAFFNATRSARAPSQPLNHSRSQALNDETSTPMATTECTSLNIAPSGGATVPTSNSCSPSCSPCPKVLWSLLRDHIIKTLKLKVRRPSSAKSWPLPKFALTKAFNCGGQTKMAYGPVMWDLRMDWQFSGYTLWTRSCVAMLEEMFMSRYWLGDYPQLPSGIARKKVKTIIRIHLMFLKKVFQNYAAQKH